MGKKSKTTCEAINIDNNVEHTTALEGKNKNKNKKKRIIIDAEDYTEASAGLKTTRKVNKGQDIQDLAGQSSPKPAFSQTTKEKPSRNLNEEDQVTEKDIDEFCDNLNDEANSQFEDWVKLIEAKLSGAHKSPVITTPNLESNEVANKKKKKDKSGKVMNADEESRDVVKKEIDKVYSNKQKSIKNHTRNVVSDACNEIDQDVSSSVTVKRKKNHKLPEINSLYTDSDVQSEQPIGKKKNKKRTLVQ